MPLETDRFRSGDDSTAAEPPPNPAFTSQQPAQCVLADVYAGLDGVERGDVKFIRILERVPCPPMACKTDEDDEQAMARLTGGRGGIVAQHGIVPVEEDGSASFYVPAGRDISFQVLDENYMAIQSEPNPLKYKPGETRGCVGCHLPSDKAASVSLETSASKRKPSMPGPQPGDKSGGILYDYEQLIQPIWNKHCILCHNAHKKSPAALDLPGKPTTLYCSSYENLMGMEADEAKRSKFNLVGGQGNEDDAGGNPEGTPPPYYSGAHASLLGLMFVPIDPKSEHFAGDSNTNLVAKVKKTRTAHKAALMFMAKEETRRVLNWLDAGCQYYGSYWGLRDLQHKESPYFRPKVTFEEVIGVRCPEALKPLYGSAATCPLPSPLPAGAPRLPDARAAPRTSALSRRRRLSSSRRRRS